MEVQIRRLTIDDFDEMIRVWSEAGLPFKPNGRDSREMLGIEMARDYVAFIGAEIEGQLVGLTIAQYDGRRAWVNRLAVVPDYRGQGLALKLMDSAHEFLEQYGEICICALIEGLNTPSMALFEKAGYVCHDDITYWCKRPRPDF